MKAIPWGWRSMWIIAMFDLPTDTPKARKSLRADFARNSSTDGFTMMQYSVYIRHCASIENAKIHADTEWVAECRPQGRSDF